MAGYALGFVMGATASPRFAFYSKCLRRCRMGPPKGSYGPRQPAPGMRRVYYDMPSTIAECGGPCSFGGPELCDCGALWRDVPTKPQPDIVPKPQYPGGYISLDGAQPFRVRRMPQPLPDELDAYTYQRGPEGDTPNPPPEVP